MVDWGQNCHNQSRPLSSWSSIIHEKTGGEGVEVGGGGWYAISCGVKLQLYLWYLRFCAATWPSLVLMYARKTEDEAMSCLIVPTMHYRVMSIWRHLRCSIHGCISLSESTMTHQSLSLSSLLDQFLWGTYMNNDYGKECECSLFVCKKSLSDTIASIITSWDKPRMLSLRPGNHSQK